jgi:hypothetical protein
MPQFRRLSAHEVEREIHRRSSVRQVVAQEYDGYVRAFDPGDYGEATIAAEEKRLTVRNRLQAAAARRGLTLAFLRVRGGDLLRFVVSERAAPEPTAAPLPAEAPAAPQQPTNGRRRKAAQAAETTPTAAAETPQPRKGRRKQPPAAEAAAPAPRRGGRRKQPPAS